MLLKVRINRSITYRPNLTLIREHPFNLKAMGFFRSQNIFFRFAAQQNFFSGQVVAKLFFLYKNNIF